MLPLNDLQIIGSAKDFETFVRWSSTSRRRQRPVHLLPRHVGGARALCRQHAQRVVQDPRRGRSHPDTEGIIFAHGSRFGGHALFIKDGTITYAYNFLGIPPEDRIQAPAPTSGKHIIGVEFAKEGMGEYREGIGPLKLYIDDQQVAEQQIRTVMGHFSLCGEGMCIGYDSADAVSSMYAGSRFEFTNGKIVKVVFDIADDAYVDVEAHLAAAMARE